MNLERVNRMLLVVLSILTAAVLAYGPLATGGVRDFDFLVIQVLAVGLAAVFSLRLMLDPAARVLWPPVCWGVIAFMAWAVLRYVQADVEYVARKELLRIGVYGLVFLIVLSLACEKGVPERLSWLLIGLGTLIAGYGVFQFVTGYSLVWGFQKPAIYVGRASGTYINPNHFAGLLEMLAPLAIAFAVRGRLPIVARILLGYAALVLLTGIGLSLSRGAWLATVVSLAVLGYWLIGPRWYRIPMVLVLVVAVGGSLAFLVLKSEAAAKRVTRPLALDGPESAYGRMWLWKSAHEMWQDHVWLGTGPGHFDVRYPRYRPPEIQARAGYAHNDYLNALAEWGVIGSALLLATWTALFAGVARSWKFVSRTTALRREPSNREALAAGATVGLSAFLIHSLTDFNFHIPGNALTAIALMAFLSSQTRFATNRYRLGRSRWARYGLALFFVAAGAGLASTVPRRILEIEALRQATAPERSLEEQQEAFLEAFTVEPKNPDTAYQVGERLRLRSWVGASDWPEQAVEAIEWFAQAATLNPYDPYPHLRTGMCLDWLGRHEEATPHYDRALELDPHNYYVLALRGWHHVQSQDYAGAIPWLERSIEFHHAWKNRIARSYLAIAKRELAAGAAKGPSGEPDTGPGVPVPEE